MSRPVRVRFAPSPTGEPHLGNIRTALFNWLFARHYGGSFIVRVEDTDRERMVEGAVESILESLRWLGLEWDEGPSGPEGASHGPHAPYFQSRRLPIYHGIAAGLLEKGALYPCFCSPQRLEEMRREQQSRKEPPGYDGRCLALSREEAAQQEGSGTPRVLRFRVPDEGTTTVRDLVRGGVSWENRLLDDFVVLKSDGYPTYHLASVVDDHLMGVSHVLRAEEWLPSTPRHLLLYQALGWEPPSFAHLPMILGADRSKLSKRHGATSALDYRRMGYLPEAMVNFLALLGWSLDDRTEIIPPSDLVRHFTLERVSRAGAIFNLEKLTWMNGVYIRDLPAGELAERLLPYLERPASEGGLPDSVARPLERGYLLRVVPLVQERLKTLGEAAGLTEFFFQDQVPLDPEALAPSGMGGAQARAALEAVEARIGALASWDEAALEAALRPLAQGMGVKTGPLFGSIRVAVTGRTAAPPLFQTMAVLGRERCLTRLRRAVEALA